MDLSKNVRVSQETHSRLTELKPSDICYNRIITLALDEACLEDKQFDLKPVAGDSDE